MKFKLELIPTKEKGKYIITEEMINKTLSYIKKLEGEIMACGGKKKK